MQTSSGQTQEAAQGDSTNEAWDALQQHVLIDHGLQQYFSVQTGRLLSKRECVYLYKLIVCSAIRSAGKTL
jgi:hypothetical protein